MTTVEMDRAGPAPEGQDGEGWTPGWMPADGGSRCGRPRVPRAVVGALTALLGTLACSSDGGNPNQPSVDVAFNTVDLSSGTGDPVVPGQVLRAAFTAWQFELGAMDSKGPVFDQSADTGDFVLGDTSLPEGWNRGIQGMRVGGRRRIFVPRNLGFNTPAVLEVDLLSAEPLLGVPFSTTDLVVGMGPPVAAGQTMTVAFTGWIYDPGAVDQKGAVFDQSDGFAFTLGDGALIDGWNRGIEGMRVGGRRRIEIPPALGFGLTPRPNIPAYSTLIFEIELISVE